MKKLMTGMVCGQLVAMTASAENAANIGSVRLKGYLGGRLGATDMIDCAAIEMVGSQFLDTGVTPTKKTRMVLDCQYTALQSSSTRSLAGVNSNSGHYDFSWGINENGKFVTYMVAPGSWQIGPTADTKRHVWDLGPGLQKIDETVIATQTSVDNPTKGFSIYLGARHTLWAEGRPE